MTIRIQWHSRQFILVKQPVVAAAGILHSPDGIAHMGGRVRYTCLDATGGACLGRPAKMSLGVVRATAEATGLWPPLKPPVEPASVKQLSSAGNLAPIVSSQKT